MNIVLYFDPSCHWTWNTYRWIKLISEHRKIKLSLEPLSLAILNNELSGENQTNHADRHLITHGFQRVIQAARKESTDDKVVSELYETFATYWHEQKKRDPEIIQNVLNDCRLSPNLLCEQDNLDWDSSLAVNIHNAKKYVGKDALGVPIIAFIDTKIGFFGPIIKNVPSVEESLAVWDGLLLLGGSPNFVELKRSRHIEDRS